MIGSIPVSITLKGPHKDCLTFLADIYKLPRLITISAVTPISGASSVSQPNVLANDSLPYTMSITATAYFFAKP